ncbi:unnamed protein product [Fraxinus pennsylvanica]|uniref:Uncharacterized protein n=1 Tax=Fraxinus pennsylvanica TaxID=56036 RepID=A0AAD2E1X1_9LAMI|nr:unnamed protein product [Fraxinus pennsylvanica]
MVGGRNRKDEGSFTVSNSNVFAVLERRKKKSDKEKVSAKSSQSGLKAGAGKSKEPEEEKPQVFWAPAPLTVKSWADVDDEDDDDYYATNAPPQSVWGVSGSSKLEESQKPDPVEESESEDDILDEGDDDMEEEHDHEAVVEEHAEPVVKKSVDASPATKEADKQLSKKERRKKELAELEAILAEIGVAPKEKAIDESSDISLETKEGQMNGDIEKKDNVHAESKSSRKKKKKDKASKEVKERQDQPSSTDVPNGQEDTTETEQMKDGASAVNVKERLKKAASAKKKKSNKEMDAAAKAAAVEAAARSAKLAAAKKKEKNHYNQQPLR